MAQSKLFAIFVRNEYTMTMKKILFCLLLLIPILAISQEPFSYDTIRVSKDDARNIHQLRNRERITTQSQAQQARRQSRQPTITTGFDARKMRYGINFGLNFSNNYSLFRLAPQVGYQFNKYVMAGVGVSYYYSKNRIYRTDERMSYISNSLGANAFAYLYPASVLVLSAQPEANYIWSHYKGDRSGKLDNNEVLVPSFVVGAGLKLGPAHAMLYYDLVQDVNSPYPSGIYYGVSVYF